MKISFELREDNSIDARLIDMLQRLECECYLKAEHVIRACLICDNTGLRPRDKEAYIMSLFRKSTNK